MEGQIKIEKASQANWEIVMANNTTLKSNSQPNPERSNRSPRKSSSRSSSDDDPIKAISEYNVRKIVVESNSGKTLETNLKEPKLNVLNMKAMRIGILIQTSSKYLQIQECFQSQMVINVPSLIVSSICLIWMKI